MTDQLAEALLADGWTVHKVSLYDEEAVEGWCWTSPDGTEVNVIGVWDHPAPPPDVDQLLRDGYPKFANLG